MRHVTCEKDVLKLVHPGRYVEIHREPITAAEVMEKNPRHCITRPDFFEYPWVVVKPESVLNLGRVFFIVPNSTIRCLLRTREPGQLSRQNQSPSSHGASPLKSYAGMTPKHLKNSQSLQQLVLRTIFCPDASTQEQKYGGRFRKQSRVETWPEPIVEHKRSTLEHEENSTDRIKWFNARDYYCSCSTDSSISLKFSERGYKDIEFDQKQNKQLTISKSCLRKEDSVRKSRHLRVSFVLPVKDEEEELQKRDMESPGFSVC